MDQRYQRRRYFSDGQCEIDAARLYRRTRHSEELGSLFVLRDDGSPHLLDGLDPHRAIAAGSRQHYRDGAVTVTRGDGLEQ